MSWMARKICDIKVKFKYAVYLISGLVTLASFVCFRANGDQKEKLAQEVQEVKL